MAGPGRGTLQRQTGEGPNVLWLSLLTTGAMLGAGLLGFLLYLVRIRIGFSAHQPPAQGAESEEHVPAETRQ